MSINNPGQLEKELSQHMSLINKEIITRGGRIVLNYSDLADTGGHSPAINWYNEITSATNGEVGKGYVANNITSVVLTLPTTALLGDMIGIVGKGAGGWIIQANAGQYIHSGPQATMSGGKIKSLHYKDSCTLVCITANTDWAVIWSNGNLGVEVS